MWPRKTVIVEHWQHLAQVVEGLHGQAEAVAKHILYLDLNQQNRDVYPQYATSGMSLTLLQKEQKKKSTARGIPEWSPSPVLTAPAPA